LLKHSGTKPPKLGILAIGQANVGTSGNARRYEFTQTRTIGGTRRDLEGRLVRLIHVSIDRTRDADIARDVADGKRGALEELYNQFAGAVKTVAWRVLRDEARAEDVVQEVFVAFWRQPDRYNPDRGSLRVYLLTMAHRKAVDIVRSEQARMRRELEDPTPVPPSIDEEVWALSLGDKVRSALAELADGERDAIALAYLDGLTYVEVARRLGAPEGTVKSRIRSGMRKLSTSLGDARGT
jgi:RNA polymerase sigma-70 factor (ECF subfamily)